MSRGSKAPVCAAGLRRRMQAGGVGRDVRHDGRHGAPRRAAQVLQRAARDPQQEQVEHGQEAELQGDRDRLDDHGGHQSTSKRASTVPTSTRSPELRPCGSLARTSRPLTRTPLVEPRSVIVQPVAQRAQLGVPARDVGVGQDDVALAAAPDGGAARRRRRSACPRPAAPRGRGGRCASPAAPPARGPRSSRPSCARGRPARRPPPRRARAAPGCRTRPGAGARRCRR